MTDIFKPIDEVVDVKRLTNDKMYWLYVAAASTDVKVNVDDAEAVAVASNTSSEPPVTFNVAPDIDKLVPSDIAAISPVDPRPAS